MVKKYYQLNCPIKDIPAEELRKLLSDLKTSELMRTIILNEKEHLTINYDRSLRNFWYFTVKPTLDKLGLLTEEDQSEVALTKWDAELSRYMAELVRQGELSYSDIKIVDNSRRRESPAKGYHVDNRELFGYQVTGSSYPNIFLCTEKDTVYTIIEDIATLFSCSCISGKGQNSFAAMEDLLRGMGKVSNDIYILAMTDYDPAGYYIADTFKKQVDDLKYTLNIKSAVHIERVGINPNQLSVEDVEKNKYSPKPNNLQKWFKATGGINGTPKGLELDALTPEQIRSIFVTSLKKYINPESCTSFVKKAYLQKVVLSTVSSKIAGITKAIAEDELEFIRMNDDLNIFDYAIAGYSYLPIANMCLTSRQPEVEARVLSYFR